MDIHFSEFMPAPGQRQQVTAEVTKQRYKKCFIIFLCVSQTKSVLCGTYLPTLPGAVGAASGGTPFSVFEFLMFYFNILIFPLSVKIM